MNTPLLSIIIPCYNGEKFINSCFNSILKQNINDFEVICINDGSKDNSKLILDNLAKSYKHIKVIHKNNEGVAIARATGLKEAKGKYITFVDIDDTLVNNSLKKMLDEIIKNDADIIISGFNIIKKNTVTKHIPIKFTQLDNVTYLKKILIGEYGWELCGKIYKKRLFSDDIQLPHNIRMVEDGAVFIQVVSKAQSILGFTQPMYNYIQHSSSATHTRSKEYAEETIEAGIFIENFLKNQYFYNQIKSEINSFFLLLYSTSTRRYFLGKNHPLIKIIRKKHYNLSAVLRIPLIKAIYVFFLITLQFDSFFQHIFKEKTT